VTNEVKITGTRYVLAVKDINQSADFYQRELGFETLWSGQGWHFLNRDNCMIMLGECPEDMSAFETNNHSYFAYIDVDNVNLLYQEFQSKEIEFVSPLEDKPWGQREFGIRTIDGHRIMFGEEINP
jgi:uncharacterized glyoxalase superfamily protein PhnB